MRPARLSIAGTDWVGVALAFLLTFFIGLPLIIVGTWAFSEVWHYPAVIPQQFGLRYWSLTLSRIVLYADQMGFDLIDAFHEAGRSVDAYTINADTPSALPGVRRPLELKADQITTDDPVGLERLLIEDQSLKPSTSQV